ncbi:MAG: AI-2E family transporter [Kiritimatiellae bacterium]|nr:AI-2E family transporter [Kiritimatiellia bacterium]
MIEFTDNQKKTIASGLTLLSLAVVFAFVGLVGWGALKALSFVSVAITPVVAGLFLALFFKPYYLWWQKIVRNPTAAVLLMMLSVIIPAGAIAWRFGSFLVDQATNLVAQAPALAAKFMDWFHQTFPKARELADSLGIPYLDWIEIYKVKAAEVGVGMLGSATGLLSGLVALVFFVYFLTRPHMRGRDYVNEMPFLKDDTRSFVAEQIDAFQDIVVSFFQRQVVICLLEGLLYGLGFMLVGLPYGFVIGFMLGVLNLVPLFGTVTCLPIALPLAYFGAGGSGLRLAGVLTVWIVGQVLDGYLITPKIQGDKTGLGYAGVIFSFFFWGAVFQSMLGLLLAIPLSAFCVVLWRSLKSKYIKPVV